MAQEYKNDRDWVLFFAMGLSLFLGEFLSMTWMNDSYGSYGRPDYIDWIISIVIGGPLVAFLLFIPVLAIASLVVAIVYWRD